MVRLLLLALLASLLAVGTADAAGKRCRPPDVDGRTLPAAHHALQAAGCRTRLRVLGDMGTGRLKVVRQRRLSRESVLIELARIGGRCRFDPSYWSWTRGSDDWEIAVHEATTGQIMWSCDRHTGARRLVEILPDVYPDLWGFGLAAVAGDWFARVVVFAGRSGGGDSIHLRRRGMATDTATYAVGNAYAVAVRHDGTLAWVEGDPDDGVASVHVVRRRTSPETVASAPWRASTPVAFADLAFDGGLLRWTQNGAPASTPVPPS